MTLFRRARLAREALVTLVGISAGFLVPAHGVCAQSRDPQLATGLQVGIFGAWIDEDVGEENRRGFGAGLEGGAQTLVNAWSLSGSHWRIGGTGTLSVIEMRVRHHAVASKLWSPFIGVSFGRAWRAWDGGPTLEENSIGIGMGATSRVVPLLAVRTEAAMRTYGFGWSAELSVGGSYELKKLGDGKEKSDLELLAGWMVPVTGPWRYAEPAITVSLENAIANTWRAGLALSIIHWQIRRNGRESGYRWDTRALMAVPSIGWRPFQGKVAVLAGPALVAMGEGPDRGSTLGISFSARAERPLGHIRVIVGAGWLWLTRSGDDQNGFIFSGGFSL